MVIDIHSLNCQRNFEKKWIKKVVNWIRVYFIPKKIAVSFERIRANFFPNFFNEFKIKNIDTIYRK